MMWCTPGMQPSALGNGLGLASAIAAVMPMWGIMCAAMMLPTVAPAVRHIALNSLEWRRRRSVAEYLTAYLGVWLAAGLLVAATTAAAPFTSRSDLALPAVLSVAAVWELLPAKQTALLACHKSEPVPLWGRQATIGLSRFGAHTGLACIGTCWATMLVMIAAGPQSAYWMPGAAAIIYSQRRTLRRRRAARAAAATLALAAGASLIGNVAT